MPKSWTRKEERQYQHVKSSAEDRGEGSRRAEEIAARTVNKNRAQSGETRTASRTSTEDMSPQRRGGLRSGKGSQGPTRDQLYNEARQRNIKGRSKMTKKQLSNALGR
ncbi:plasmid stabilization protein [Nocardia vermiculata]|uniref:Plasmid stabilization protein n=1 Tax=Nocardia vermiculata TaxID=257274 RepID=A0A846XYQ8_9NOCA|nr:plasmid stabilization protein [Nocardia vermiculata]NKY49369.1 plasmid stabilization protein [Nocardia vermiculata]